MNPHQSVESWAPYMTWAKHHPPSRFDLCGSNLLHCTLDDLPGIQKTLQLHAQNDEGFPPLLKAIAQRFGVGTERVATAPGAAGACFLTMAALVRPGDKVLVEWPGYDPHGGAARLLGADVEVFERSWDDGFKVDPDTLARHLTSGVRVIVMTNLHNPSGVYTDPWTLLEVADVAASVGAKIIVDEVYLETVRGEDTTPAAGRHEAFVSVNSLTKSFGLAGLRVGWILADPETVERVRRVRDVVDGVGPVPTERMGVVAFEHIDALIQRARSILQPNARLLWSFVESRDELDWMAPAVGSPIGFPKLVGVDDAAPFVEMARQEFGVGVVPGHLFGAPAHFRVAVGGARRVVEDGLDALEKALDRGFS